MDMYAICKLDQNHEPVKILSNEELEIDPSFNVFFTKYFAEMYLKFAKEKYPEDELVIVVFHELKG